MCMSKHSLPGFLVRVSVTVKRHHGQGNSYKRKHFIVVAYSSEFQSIIIMVGHGDVQANMVLER